LFECADCGLRFRVPKDDVRSSRSYYENEYDEGFTTRPPEPGDLGRLLKEGFAGHYKDCAPYLEVLSALGLSRGARVLDFGCSWGYGSWQLAKAGFDVVACEISPRNARFASDRLGVRIVEDPSQPPWPVDCFFSSHVMEHLPDPNVIWGAAGRALKADGVFVGFFPNGDPRRREEGAPYPYHEVWGKDHPMALTARSLKHIAARHGFHALTYTNPYPLDDIRALRDGDMGGLEALVVARRNPS
jgi:SAM-dependent methyltransferase